MKNFYLSIQLIILSQVSISQSVSILDDNFASYLQALVPTCMNGNTLDISCANNSGITQMIIDNQGLTDLSGVEHFTSLTTLFCGMNEITNIPALPPNLEQFIAGQNQLTTIPSLPNSLLLLDCSHNQITSLPELPSGLTELMCFNNQLSTLNNLPHSLKYIVASYNQITEINYLPNELNYLDISHNALTQLPQLPTGLTMLACGSNILTELPELPNLLTMRADSNEIRCFPTFPSTINTPILDFVFLTISGNPFTCLPNHILAMTADLLNMPICSESPEADIHNCALSTGLSENELEVQIYPNPNNGSFSIKLDAHAQIELMNNIGQRVLFKHSNEGVFLQISLQNTIPGIYFVSIKTGDFNKVYRISVSN